MLPALLLPASCLFLSTLSLRRATGQGVCTVLPHSDFYPRSPCGERPPAGKVIVTSVEISIHALLAESDRKPQLALKLDVYFYPRSPCGERRLWACNGPAGADFYPRSPCGERLLLLYSVGHLYVDFYPRSPCGERPVKSKKGVETIVISIHALLAESDDSSYGALAGATISIHALLAESDTLA